MQTPRRNIPPSRKCRNARCLQDFLLKQRNRLDRGVESLPQPVSQPKSGDMESSSTMCTPVEVTVPDGDCGETESLDDALEAGGVVPDTHCDVEGGGTPTASNIWLKAWSSVRYEERGDIQGLRYSTDDGKEGWTPIEISRKTFQGRR